MTHPFIKLINNINENTKRKRQATYTPPVLTQRALNFTFGDKTFVLYHPTGGVQSIRYDNIVSTELYSVPPQFGDNIDSWRLTVKNGNGRVTNVITVHQRFQDSLRKINEGLINRIGY